MNIVNSVGSIIGYFILIYPISMAVVWVVSALIFWWKYERCKEVNVKSITDWPMVTILIPCHNEEEIIGRTCKELLHLEYPNYQVVFIDDDSRDRTSEIIREWVNHRPNYHLLRILENQGKSNALNSALAITSNTPVTIVMDADTIPHPLSLKILVKELFSNENMGAVTGQPIVYNRGNVLEKLQTVEFTSIIGLIKRAQNLYGHIFSISGCITAFKTEALHRVNGFSARTATEDIDITWTLQRAKYRVKYVPQAVAYIQVPNKVMEFWKQRKRWALGGWHLLRTHKDILLFWKHRRLWVIYIDIMLSYIWSILFISGSLIWILSSFFYINNSFVVNPLPTVSSILIIICVIQFGIAITLNRKYDPEIKSYFYLIPWYPFFYFIVGALSVSRTSLKGLFKSLDSAGKWRSPARIKQMKS
jgi:poly-beta-1,6-N-acetyl-D-glucosamine synthase